MPTIATRGTSPTRAVAMGVAGAVLTVAAAGAAIQDSTFAISPDGARVELDLREVSRREALERLFAGRGVQIDWQHAASATEVLSGRFEGTLAAVTHRLLVRTNFIVSYGQRDGARRIARVIVLGPAIGKAAPPPPAGEPAAAPGAKGLVVAQSSPQRTPAMPAMAPPQVAPMTAGPAPAALLTPAPAGEPAPDIRVAGETPAVLTVGEAAVPLPMPGAGLGISLDVMPTPAGLVGPMLSPGAR